MTLANALWYMAGGLTSTTIIVLIVQPWRS
jgi:hypothetical protein